MARVDLRAKAFWPPSMRICVSEPVRTVGRAAPKSQAAPDGPSMRASCSGTHHQRAGFKRTSADFKDNGHLSGLSVDVEVYPDAAR